MDAAEKSMIESDAATGPALPRVENRASRFVQALTARRGVAVPLGVALFSLLTALGAHVAVPLGFTPVPMTLQTLAVLLAGALLGPYGGAASQLLYMGMGFAGMPFFSMGGAGLPWALGPTGGYLVAFPLAAATVGFVAGRDGGLLRTVLGMVAATAAIFALGAGWLAAVTDLDARGVFAAGVQPFLVGAVIKIGIAATVARQWRARRRAVAT